MPLIQCPICYTYHNGHPAYGQFCSIKCAIVGVHNSKSKAQFDNTYYIHQEPLDISIFTWCPYCDESPLKWKRVCYKPHGCKHKISKRGLYCELCHKLLDEFEDYTSISCCTVCGFRINERDLSELFPMNKVEMIWKPDLGAYQVRFPYDKTMLDFLKSKIPSGYRTPDYDENGKFRAWLIDKDFATLLLDVLKLKFRNCQFTVITKEKVDEYNQGSLLATQTDPNTSLKTFIELLHNAGLVNGTVPDFKAMTLLDATKYYRRAALYYHPDRNPQLAKEMSSLNKAWSELKGAFWK